MFAGSLAGMHFPPARVLYGLLLIALVALLGCQFWQVAQRDDLAKSHASHLAATAVKQFSREVEVLARDYGYWNEAHRNLSEAPDAGWVAENIILSDLQDLLGIEAFLVLDTMDQPVFAEMVVPAQAGEGPDWAALPALLAGGLDQLIAHVRRQEVSRPLAASAFVSLGDRTALAVVSPVLPFEEEPAAEVAGSTVSLLVFLRPLSEPRLGEMAADFGLSDLALESSEAQDGSSLPLLKMGGVEAARLTWTASQADAPSPGYLAALSVFLSLTVAGLGYGSVVAWGGFCQARREAELREAAAEQSASNFISHVSHDLRRPLSAITGLSELLKTDVITASGSKRYFAYLSDVLLATRRLIESISRVLDVTQIRGSGPMTEIESVDAWKLLEDVRSMLLFRLKRSDVTLKAEGFVPGLKVRSDPVALKQILLELISNAMSETPAGGEVVIQAHRIEGDWVELAVADQGEGLSHQRISVLLHPFEGLAPDSSPDVDLGLSVIQALVRLQGGALTVMSKPAAGTIILLRLPAG